MCDLASLCGIASLHVSFSLSGMIRAQQNMDEGTESVGSRGSSPPNQIAKHYIEAGYG